ncbi:MAG: type VI secretion system baseplate subunit TssE [Desulfohalobiaceae bacterium]|nr:type VI secretion system baseplate subunit TssE [Desulfohalobiaceae bacterium]
MQGLRLLERLQKMEEDPDSRGVWDAQEIRESVFLHLLEILNSKQGSALIADDIGMPDFTDIVGDFRAETFARLEKYIIRVIGKYEPRLDQVKVRALPKDDLMLSLRFKVEGVINFKRTSIRVSFETIVDPEGKISLSEK